MANYPPKYKCNGRPITIMGSYDGHGPDDPSGVYYRFDDDPAVVHWISAGATAVRFEPINEPSLVDSNKA